MISRPAIAVAAVLALVALAGAIWLLLDSGPEHGGGGARIDQADPLAAPTRAAPAGSGAGAIDVKRFSTDADAADAGGIRVQVVDESDRPVPQAKVEMFRDRDMGGMRFMMGPGGEETNRRPMQTLTADEAGTLTIEHAPRRSIELVGRVDRRVGALTLDPREVAAGNGPELRLVLKPIKTIDVEVVDAQGAAVPGVRVRATIADDQRQQSRSLGWTSDPDGKTSLELTSLDGQVYEAPEVSLQATLPGLAPVSENVTPKEGVARAVIHVPAVVVVLVNVKVAEGETLPRDLTLQWQVDQTGDASDPRRFGAFWGGSFGQRTFHGAKTVIGGFQPGATGTFTLNTDDHLASTKPFKLPTDSHTYTLDIDLGKKQPYLTAKLVNEKGQPITEGSFAYEIEQPIGGKPADAAPGAVTMAFGARGGGRMRMMGGPGRNSNQLEPDDQGMVKVPVTPDTNGSLKVYDSDSPDFGGDRPPEPATQRTFDPVPSGATVPVADLVIPRRPVLAAGTVKNADGKPVESARVSFDFSQIGDFNPSLFALMRESTRTNAKGAFELRGTLDGSVEGLKLLARVRGARSEPREFTKGETDVEITLVKTGGIAGTAKLALPELTRRLEVEATLAERADNGNRGRARWMMGPGGGGQRATIRSNDPKFELKDLPAGRYDVTFTYDGQDALTVDDVEVKSGETSHDPRLAAVIIGSNALLAAVTVLSPEGAPVANADVTFDTSDPNNNAGNNNRRGGGPGGPGGRGFGRDQRTTDKTGTATNTFIEPPAKMTVRVRAEGYTDATVENAAFPLTVRLDRGTELTVLFDVPGGLPAIDGVKSYRVRATPSDPAAQQARANGADVTVVTRGQGPWNMGGRGRSKSATVASGATSATITALSAGTWALRVEPIFESDMGAMFRGFGIGVDVGSATIPTGATSFQVKLKLEEAVLAQIRALKPDTGFGPPGGGGQGPGRNNGGRRGGQGGAPPAPPAPAPNRNGG